MRKALSRLIAGIPVRIKGGPNEGARWSLPASGRHRAGTFEWTRLDAILSLTRPADCFWDIGAHHGYVSLAASGAVGSDGHVYSFEPSAFNFGFLERHVDWNDADNVTPMNLGVAAAPGRVRFGGSGSSQAFQIGGGSEEAEVTSIETLLDSGVRAPDIVKIDVEGAEGEILATGASHLPPTAVVIVAVHSRASYDACVEALRTADFGVYLSEPLRALRDSGRWGGDDPDLIGVGPEAGDRADRVAGLPGYSAP